VRLQAQRQETVLRRNTQVLVKQARIPLVSKGLFQNDGNGGEARQCETLEHVACVVGQTRALTACECHMPGM
jgi:hypothetical protein